MRQKLLLWETFSFEMNHRILENLQFFHIFFHSFTELKIWQKLLEHQIILIPWNITVKWAQNITWTKIKNFQRFSGRVFFISPSQSEEKENEYKKVWVSFIICSRKILHLRVCMISFEGQISCRTETLVINSQTTFLSQILAAIEAIIL